MKKKRESKQTEAHKPRRSLLRQAANWTVILIIALFVMLVLSINVVKCGSAADIANIVAPDHLRARGRNSLFRGSEKDVVRPLGEAKGRLEAFLRRPRG